MTELEQVIQAIEHGLLPTARSSEHPARKKDLSQRMKYYKVPGVSTAFVYQGELACSSDCVGVDPGRPHV